MKRKANKKSKTQELQTEPEQPSNLNQSTTGWSKLFQISIKL